MARVDSATIELSAAQENVLMELLHLHGERGASPVKGKEIAAALDRNPGTIRTQMQSLKSLQLVTGIPGPKGGYEPTARAFELANADRDGAFTSVPIRREGERLPETTVTEIDLLDLHHPDRAEAEVSLQGSIRQLAPAESVTIGPLPRTDLIVTGAVEGVDASSGVFVLDVDDVRVAGVGEGAAGD